MMNTPLATIASVAATAFVSFAQPALAQEETDQRFGTVHFDTSCNEVEIFYAIALNVGASPNDKSYANQLKGAAILDPIFRRQPRHPGVAHYLIHLHDTPALAQGGLDAARRYSAIAPSAPHAQHMP